MRALTIRRLGMLIGLALVASVSYHVATNSVLLRPPWANVDCIECGGPGFVLLNPFRDRGPERVAEIFLQRIKDGKCVEAMATLPTTDERRKYVCEAQRDYLVERWRLGDRYDKTGEITLVYLQWNKNQQQEVPSWLWITIERGRSTIKDYQPIF